MKYPNSTRKLVISHLKASQVTLIRCLNEAHLWFKLSRSIGNAYKAIVEVIGIDLALNGEGMEQT
jgi:hypothetical protein